MLRDTSTATLEQLPPEELFDVYQAWDVQDNDERELCHHPAYLLERVTCVDRTTGEDFVFCLLTDEERDELHAREDNDPLWLRTSWDWERGREHQGWLWQRELLDEWRSSGKHVSLKARQIGVTWLAAGDALHTALYKPGVSVLVVSIKEAEAIKVLVRIWGMLHSLPKHLWNGAQVKKPVRGTPTSAIELIFPDGRVSLIEALTSSPNAGHGTTAALVILDEYARQEYASDTWKAVLPTTQGGGRVIVISTGNGVSVDHGQGRVGGNYFHFIWTNAKNMGLRKRFLSWDLHPDRDSVWYRAHAEGLPAHDRGEQYPQTELEAFILTGSPFFDVNALAYYAEHVQAPRYCFDFHAVWKHGRRYASRQEHELGRISVFREPQEEHKYAVGADVATGKGLDFSCAYVVDLADMALVAEFHGRIAQDLYAEQLHYLGRWYNDALLAIETGGGYGDAVIIALRKDNEGRPAYPRLYRHLLSTRPDLPTAKPWGFPMSVKTRPLVINQLERAIRDHTLPWVSDRLMAELRTFVHHHESLPSPRAQDGANDDAVMACAVTLEMFRLKGQHPMSARRRASVSHYKPWLSLDSAA